MAKPEIKANFTARSLALLHHDLGLLALDKKSKSRILRNAMNRVKKEARSNITKQREPDGKPWEPRKKAKLNDKGKPQKMLLKILRKSKIKIEGDSVILYYENKGVGQTAARHNYGGEVPVSDKKDKGE